MTTAIQDTDRTLDLDHAGRGAYSISELARMLGKSRRAVYMQAYRGRIPSQKVGGTVMIPASYIREVTRGLPA